MSEDHPTMSETSNPIGIWPSGSRPCLWLALVSRSVGVFLCVAVVVARLVFPSLVSLFWELSPRPFPPFGAFLFLRLCCPGPVFSVGSEPGRFDGLNKFSPSWTKMVQSSFLVVWSGRLGLAVSGR